VLRLQEYALRPGQLLFWQTGHSQNFRTFFGQKTYEVRTRCAEKCWKSLELLFDGVIARWGYNVRNCAARRTCSCPERLDPDQSFLTPGYTISSFQVSIFFPRQTRPWSKLSMFIFAHCFNCCQLDTVDADGRTNTPNMACRTSNAQIVDKDNNYNDVRQVREHSLSSPFILTTW
jgi:hypothetical protein